MLVCASKRSSSLDFFACSHSYGNAYLCLCVRKHMCCVYVILSTCSCSVICVCVCVIFKHIVMSEHSLLAKAINVFIIRGYITFYIRDP